ncbi:MAG: transcriptional regulator [Candidatus Poseidoniia archaeon]|nr:transcriptional regulator [Candidatus Poseidoniia archaeon]
MNEQLTRRMAGEIVVSDSPGETLRKWREIFQLSQKHLASLLGVNPSVVCDFEKGRRRSPGIATVRRLVETMVSYDRAHGSRVVTTMAGQQGNPAITSIQEFTIGLKIANVVKAIGGEVLAGAEELERPIYGYTIVDALRAITTFSGANFGQMYGWSNERALLFTGVQFGRSPMIAVRAHPVKPRLVCYIQPGNVDELAAKLAKMERIVLVRTDLSLGQVQVGLGKL